MAPITSARRQVRITLHNETSRRVRVSNQSNVAAQVDPHGAHDWLGSPSVTVTDPHSGASIAVTISTRWSCRRRTKLVDDNDAELPFLLYQQRTAKRHYRLLVLPKVSTSSWLAELPDDLNLASLYVPGTHETMAYWGGPISCCQTYTLSLMEQLVGGIRMIDIRLALKNGTLKVYHGIQNEYAQAEDVVDTIYAFLQSRPTETVIVSIKQENAVPDFETVVWRLLDQRREVWYRENRWPTLGEVRGRAVVFCRFGYESQQGLHPVSWPDNAAAPFMTDIGGRNCTVQDWYNIGGFIKIPEKAALVLSLFRRRDSVRRSVESASTFDKSDVSTKNTDGGMTINFASGATLLTGFPFIVAKGLGFSLFGFPGVNERVLDGLVRLLADGALPSDEEEGMALLLDFWEFPQGLAELVISLNFVAT
ncbi:hypothetical protein ACM66B_001412 [Microbotryomycetes sp. NB124-2]